MNTARALNAIEAVVIHHRGGHRCTNGDWHNDNVGTRERCPVRKELDAAADEVRRLSQVVHNAAHDTDAVDALVAGLTSTPVSEFPVDAPSVLEAWRMMARLGLESLAAHLDEDSSPEGRRAAAAAELVRQRINDGTVPPDQINL